MPAPLTYWIPKNHLKGSVQSSTENSIIDTQADFDLITQAGDTLIVNPNIVIPIEPSLWTDTEA